MEPVSVVYNLFKQSFKQKWSRFQDKKNKLLSWLSLVTAFSTEKGFGAGAPPLLLEEEEEGKKKTRNKDEWSETE